MNDTHIAEDANLDYQKLYELYRAMNASAVDHLWELNKMDLVRRWVFCVFSASYLERVLQFRLSWNSRLLSSRLILALICSWQFQVTSKMYFFLFQDEMCKYKNLTQKQTMYFCFVVYPFILSHFYSLVLLSPLSVHDFSCLSPPRSLFLSTIPESADLKMIKFIDKRLKASDLNETEASQLVVVGLNHVSVTPEIINVAKVRNW